MENNYGGAYLAACEIYGWQPSFIGYQNFVHQIVKGYRNADGTWRRGGHNANKNLQTVR